MRRRACQALGHGDTRVLPVHPGAFHVRWVPGEEAR